MSKRGERGRGVGGHAEKVFSTLSSFKFQVSSSTMLLVLPAASLVVAGKCRTSMQLSVSAPCCGSKLKLLLYFLVLTLSGFFSMLHAVKDTLRFALEH